MTIGSLSPDIPRESSTIARNVLALHAIAWPFSLVFVVIAFLARVPTYRVAPLFLIPLLWLVYFLRDRLNLHPLHYLLYAVALLLHDLGAFGWYQGWPLPISFDIVVHFYFGLAGAFLLLRALEHHLPLRRWRLWVGTLLLIMGLGAIHELVEYASYLALGEEKGMLKPARSYFFDTQRDLLNNFLGCNLALLLYFVVRGIRSRS